MSDTKTQLELTIRLSLTFGFIAAASLDLSLTRYERET